MEIAAIRQFIANPVEFERGVELYCLHGDNDALKNLLKNSRKSDFLQKKLIVALQEIADKNPTPKKSPKNPKDKSKGTNPDEWVFSMCGRFKAHYTELPEQVWTKRKENGQLYREIKKLHAQLDSTPEGEELAALVRQIVNLGKASRSNRYIIDYWLQFRRNAPEAKLKTNVKKNNAEGLSNNPAILIQRRNNLRSRITKAKKKGDAVLLAELIEEKDLVSTKLAELSQ